MSAKIQQELLDFLRNLKNPNDPDVSAAKIFAEYLAKNQPLLTDLVQNIERSKPLTLFIPSDEALEYTRGLLRNISAKRILDKVALNHVSFTVEPLRETKDIRMASGNDFRFDQKTDRIDRGVIWESLLFKAVNVHVVNVVFATRGDKDMLIRA